MLTCRAKLRKLFIIGITGASLVVSQVSAQGIIPPSDYLGGLDTSKGYCENAHEELRFWAGINRLAKSFLGAAPQVSPENRAYFREEINSGDVSRVLRVLEDPLLKMQSLRDGVQSLAHLSDIYIERHSGMKLHQKVEIIGRAIFAVEKDANISESALRNRRYYLSTDVLVKWQIHSLLLRPHLVNHLICYGSIGGR